MADRLVFTPPEVMRQMVDDLIAIAGIPTERIARLSQQVEQQIGFLTEKKLLALVTENIEDEGKVSAVFNALQNLRPAALDQLLEMIQTWRQADERNSQRFPNELYTELQQKLPSLIGEYPALDRSQKAERLRTMLGDELKGVAFICDARPVYNEARDRIEGLIPLTTMKLVYERQTLSTEEIEIKITPKQLKDLISEAQKAEKKLATLHESVAGWIPDGCVDAEE